MRAFKQYIVNILLSLDILARSIWPFPLAKPRETISGMLGSDYQGSIIERFIDWLFYKMGWWNDNNHCEDISREEEQIQKIIEEN